LEIIVDKYLNKVMIIDGSYILHRSLNTPGFKELSTTSGMKSGGVYGALRILQSEMRKFPSYFPIFCFDQGLAKRRTDLYPDYKANRKRKQADDLIGAGASSEEDDYLKEYHRQRADLIEILKSLGIPSLIFPGWEGDDLQYLLSIVSQDCVVVSDDKDMIQLVSPSVKVRRSMRDQVLEWDTCEDYYKHPRFTIRKSIVGDGSDNIIQCATGVGDKTADKIAQIIEKEEFENYKTTLEKYCEDNEKGLVPKIKVLLNNWDQFIINYNLINLRLVEVPPEFETLIKDKISLSVHANVMEAYKLIGRYEINTIYPDQIIARLSMQRLSLFD
jgi:5'-3' exonuclease